MEAKNVSRLRSQPEGDVAVDLALYRGSEQEHVVVADILSLAVRKIWVAPITALGAALVAWFLSSLMTPVYVSSAVFRLGTTFSIGSTNLDWRTIVPVEPIEQVYKRIGFEPSVEVKSDNGRMFIVRVGKATPEMAQESARLVVEGTLAKHAALSERVKTVTQRKIADFHKFLRTDDRDTQKRMETILMLREMEIAIALMEPTAIVIPPALPEEPARPRTGRNIALGFTAGLVIGLLISFLCGYVKYVMMRSNVQPFPRQ